MRLQSLLPVLFVLPLALTAVGCGDTKASDAVTGCPSGEQDLDGDGACLPDCATANLSCQHGACSDVSGRALCACDSGYAGTTCSVCAPTWQDKDGNGTCKPGCEIAKVSCTHGFCSDKTGTAQCACSEGYAGTICDRCDTGWQDADGDGICKRACSTAGLQCGQGYCSSETGVVHCNCAAGYTGDSCEKCATGFQDKNLDGICKPTCAKAKLKCTTNGACSDESGTAQCECKNGYAGVKCTSCATGYQDKNSDGVCEPACVVGQCGHGSCMDTTGEAVCSCAKGYQGAKCLVCAAGYQDKDGNGECLPDCSQANLGCLNGACSDLSGTAKCACDLGYAGNACMGCAVGYQDKDGNGVCQPGCTETTCTKGLCSDASGIAVCTCPVGYTGPNCATCAVGYQDVDGDGVCNAGCTLANLGCKHGACSEQSGTAVCQCPTEYVGAKCETCAPGNQDADGNGTCAPTCDTAKLACVKGACSDASGKATCECDEGYGGDLCETCAQGWQDNDQNGACLPACSTAGLDCGHGQCADTTGKAACVCETGYEGNTCKACVAGYQDLDEDGTCSPTCDTANLACVFGKCSDSDGTADCFCDDTHAGTLCAECKAGLQDKDSNGSCTADCSTANLTCNKGTCADTTGTALCVCDAGYKGETCTACNTGWQDNDADGICEFDCASAALDCGEGACSDSTGQALCVCNQGYQDNDKNGKCTAGCGVAQLSCPEGETCNDASGVAGCHNPWPNTCATVKGVTPNPQDAEYTLFFANDPTRPWQAWCDDVAGTPTEYLSVAPESNFSTCEGGGGYPAGKVVTTWSRVRIDPVTLVVTVSDYAFATSTGAIAATPPIAKVPYASACNCTLDKGAAARIDLSGTPFELADTFCSIGFLAFGGITPANGQGQTLDLTGGGFCGTMGPCTQGVTPNLQLSILPCPNHTQGADCGTCTPDATACGGACVVCPDQLPLDPQTCECQYPT